jgi:hypothetical protein
LPKMGANHARVLVRVPDINVAALWAGALGASGLLFKPHLPAFCRSGLIVGSPVLASPLASNLIAKLPVAGKRGNRIRSERVF